MADNDALDAMLMGLDSQIRAHVSTKPGGDLANVQQHKDDTKSLTQQLTSAVVNNPPTRKEQVASVMAQNDALRTSDQRSARLIDASKAADKLPKKKVQICVLMDGTGSMSRIKDEVMRSISQGVLSLGNASRLDITVALVMYRDYAYAAEERFEIIDFAPVRNFVVSLSQAEAMYGPQRGKTNDEPEDVLGGFSRMLTALSWAPESLKACLWTGDAPGHGELVDPHPDPAWESGPDDYPGPNPEGLTHEKLIDEMIDKRINIGFMRVHPVTDHMLAVFDKAFAERGGAAIEQVTLDETLNNAMEVVKKLLKTSVESSVTNRGPTGALRAQKAQGRGAPVYFEVTGEQLLARGIRVSDSQMGPSMMALLKEDPVFDVKPLDMKVADGYFGRGGVRYAYHAVTKSGKKMVAKDFQMGNMDTKRCHVLEAQASIVASHMAHFFCVKLDIPATRFTYVQPVIIDRGQVPKQGSRFYSAETHIPGDMEKFNINTGVVLEAHAQHSLVQAFSHFTFHASDHQLIVLDVQGVASKGAGNVWSYQLTDPAVATHNPADFPNMTNLGGEAFQQFMVTHECTEICAQLGLPRMTSDKPVVIEDQPPLM
jgi:hypothetical protein